MAEQQQADVTVGETSPLDEARTAVLNLYEFRDNYFESHCISQAIKKEEDVNNELKKTLEVLQELQDKVQQKADFLMLHGKALNVLPQYSKQAEELLSKAVKLDPQLVDAWVQLGEVYWKDKRIEDAKNCFQGALNHGKDKTALRNLSMVMRQISANEEERGKLVEDSVEKAKEAVQCDVQDGTSWCILGNAYLSLFFASTQNPKLLKQCMSAYQQAERDKVANCNPDLHFNRAVAFKYEENYKECLEGFAKAAALDPTWDEPKFKEQQTLNYLGKVEDLVKSKGKLKAKRLANFTSSIGVSDLGPYKGGSYTSRADKTVKLEPALLSDLRPQLNSEKVIIGKVVCSVTTDEPVPFTFCIVDQTKTCFAVTVYNIAPGYGVKIGDSVAIPEPYLQEVNFTYNGKTYQFNSIRVGSPVVMVVNGRKLTMEKQAPTQLALSNISD